MNTTVDGGIMVIHGLTPKALLISNTDTQKLHITPTPPRCAFRSKFIPNTFPNNLPLQTHTTCSAVQLKSKT